MIRLLSFFRSLCFHSFILSFLYRSQWIGCSVYCFSFRYFFNVVVGFNKWSFYFFCWLMFSCMQKNRNNSFQHLICYHFETAIDSNGNGINIKPVQHFLGSSELNAWMKTVVIVTSLFFSTSDEMSPNVWMQHFSLKICYFWNEKFAVYNLSTLVTSRHPFMCTSELPHD